MTKREFCSQGRRVVICALPGSFALDVLGPFEIFVGAARLLALRAGNHSLERVDLSLFAGVPLAYDVELFGPRRGGLETLSGAVLDMPHSLAALRGPVDTLIVAGGDVGRMLAALKQAPELMRALRRAAKRARRVVSVCTGAFVLAAAGLLDGRRATTHWASCAELQARYPEVHVEREPIFTRDGNVYTSAGATAGMDLALDLVREDHGSEIAQEIARWLVLYVTRSGSQAQLSVSLQAQATERKPLRDLQLWISEHLRGDLSVEALAARAGMSVRNFARAFKHEMGTTPAAYVESARVEAARRKLELGSASIEQVASEVGFGSPDTLRRAFARTVGRPPSSERATRTGAAKKRVATPALRVLRGGRT